MATVQNDSTNVAGDFENVATVGVWVKPEIVAFKPLASAEGAGFGAGEGINNVS